MSGEDDTYSTIFTALKHPIRRKILRRLQSSPATYTELLNELTIENGLLNYHLESIKELVTKQEDGKYTLNEFGKAGVQLLQRVEEPITRSEEIKKATPELLRLKVLAAMLLFSLVIISGLFINVNNRYNAIQPELLSMEKTKLINLSLGSLTERIELVTSFPVGSKRPVLPILINDFLVGVFIPSDVNGFPVQVFGADKIYQYLGYPQYFQFTKTEITSDHALIQMKSVPAFLSGTPPFGVDLTLTFVKVSGDWQIASFEGGVYPEG